MGRSVRPSAHSVEYVSATPVPATGSDSSTAWCSHGIDPSGSHCSSARSPGVFCGAGIGVGETTGPLEGADDGVPLGATDDEGGAVVDALGNADPVGLGTGCGVEPHPRATTA